MAVVLTIAASVQTIPAISLSMLQKVNEPTVQRGVCIGGCQKETT
jgi:hypothetical protein